MDADVILPNKYIFERFIAFIFSITKTGSIKKGDCPKIVSPIPINYTDYSKYGINLRSGLLKYVIRIVDWIVNLGVMLMMLLHSTYIVTGQIIATRTAFQQLKGFNEKIKLGDDVDFVRRARQNNMFYGWAPAYVEVSDRRNTRLLYLLAAPFLLLGGLTIEFLVWFTKNRNVFYWWMDKVVAPIYGQLGGKSQK